MLHIQKSKDRDRITKRMKKKARSLSENEMEHFLSLLVVDETHPKFSLHDVNEALFLTMERDLRLRGGAYYLDWNEILIVKDEDGYEYLELIEAVPKSNQMGLKNLSADPLEHRQYEDQSHTVR
mmetsp:Transcript_30419/g.41968  ORF Transcript_30419/g.41968 Transcript_30419/m.41968 type:complete len:124 (-) Transcript_30419:113-484(-)|eukprot:CAMPEP_0201483974 /NCGR_PEP_ID=MMETSP0151_2-20130828/8166_1 /ASSEMBLY_ACC=CAM_ASM_000257 /TAXON_ID=200890 /ORGANISM="Paramoeba atlantica, Strain 621/1 / CCAP 1560/9" /LENGTH=123 /DNA_ID=CAMNT_0047867379 /DNA_START=376 /DNA_END=747 /DNA_ORIENTATION=-